MVRLPLLLVTGDPVLLDEVRAAAPPSAEVSHARSASSALVLARARRPAVVLLDITATGDVAAAVRTLVGEGGPPVLLVVGPGCEPDVVDLLVAGAAGAVERSRIDTLPACLPPALAGETVLSRDLVGRLVDEYRLRDGARRGASAPSLTAREREVLELLRRGRTTGDVAQELGLEPVTVRSHIAHAVRKMRARSRQEAVEELHRPRSGADAVGPGGTRTGGSGSATGEPDDEPGPR